MKASNTFGKPKKIVMVAANPAVSTTLGFPVGFWASELFHPHYEFMEAGYEIDFASPNGGRVEVDNWSDPRDASKYSADDVLSLGYLSWAEFMQKLENTAPVSEVKMEDYDAIFVCGGQSPMFTFPQATDLHELFAKFYEAEKVSAVICHGTCLLLFAKLSNGELLAKGKAMTGFANSEEDFADNYVGQKLMPFRIEDEAKKLGINFITRGFRQEFAVRDGNLITGQQQYSGRAAAKMVIEALGA